MATKTLHCSVITPERQVYEGEADMAVIPAHDGEVGIMPGRAPLLSMLGAGEMRVYTGDRHERWFVNAGFAQVIANRLIVLTQEAVPSAELDVADAERRLAEAHGMPAVDEVGTRRKAEAENAARARIRLARR